MADILKKALGGDPESFIAVIEQNKEATSSYSLTSSNIENGKYAIVELK